MAQRSFCRFGNSLLCAMVAGVCFGLLGCKDPCQKVVCKYGDCIKGVCHCQQGYVGDSCSVEARSMYYGTYNVTEICSQTGFMSYTVNIRGDSLNLFRVLIANFGNAFSNDVWAEVYGTSITIPSQAPDNDGRMVKGGGTFYNQDSISMYYTIGLPSGVQNVCNQSYWKK